jgi:MFS family permease
MSIFYFSSAFSGAFSGLLAAGIAQMDGLANLGGWRWIFIIEGIVSVLIGMSVFYLLPDTPSLSGRWLEPGEIRFLNLIHQATRGSSLGELADAEKKKMTFWETARQVVFDGKIYLQVLVYCSNSVPNYGMH